MKIYPQLILEYTENNEINQVIFLSYNEKEDIIESPVYKLYEILSQSKTFKNEYKIIKAHIFLTLNVNEIKAYIKYLLNINYNFILFSLFNNIEYYYDNQIFSPFINLKVIPKERNDTEYFYMFYNDAVNKAIFCIFPSNKENIISYNPSWEKFSDKIINNIIKYDYQINIDKIISISYVSNLTYNTIFQILQNMDLKIIFLSHQDNDIFISGMDLKLYENNVLFVYDNFDELIFYYDYSFNVSDNDKFNDLNLNIDIKNKVNIYKYIVSFDTKLYFNIDIDFNFDFFIKTNKTTKNIFNDIGNKLTIITSKDHINFKTRYENDLLIEYFTYMILGYNNIYNEYTNVNKNIKINNLYISRFCQNSKNIFRKPILIEGDFDKNNYIQLSPNFYRGKIINNKKLSDIYINQEGLHYKCQTDNTYINFISNIYKTSNICLPCCYNNDKTHTNIFKKCVYDQELSSKINLKESIDPYIQKNMKVLYSNNKLGLLNDKLNSILNKNNILKLKNLRIDEAKNYIVYMKEEESDDNILFDELISYIEKKNDNYIIFNEDNIYINRLDYFDNYKILIYIKNKLYKLVRIDKKKNVDKIEITELNNDKEFIHKIISKFKLYFNNQLFYYKYKDILIEYNYNNLYINNFIYNNYQTNYIIKYNKNQPIIKLPYNIDNILCQNKYLFLFTNTLNNN